MPVPVTLKDRLDAAAVPPLVASALVVLVNEPSDVPLMIRSIVHPPGGIFAPDGTDTFVEANDVVEQVLVLFDVSATTPGGSAFVNGALSVIAELVALPSVIASFAVVPTARLVCALPPCDSDCAMLVAVVDVVTPAGNAMVK